MDNYIMFEGKKIPLTKEQVAELKNQYKFKSPFERRERNEKYYYIDEFGNVCGRAEDFIIDNDVHFGVANYGADLELMRQRALHETLDRLLWRFSIENGEMDNPWDIRSNHYYIKVNKESKRPEFTVHGDFFKKGNTTYFLSKELAYRAIDEIIKPFMKAHRDFVW